MSGKKHSELFVFFPPHSLRTKLTKSCALAKEAAALYWERNSVCVYVQGLAINTYASLQKAFDKLEGTQWINSCAGDVCLCMHAHLLNNLPSYKTLSLISPSLQGFVLFLF